MNFSCDLDLQFDKFPYYKSNVQYIISLLKSFIYPADYIMKSKKLINVYTFKHTVYYKRRAVVEDDHNRASH
jgi:hypothetical protein